MWLCIYLNDTPYLPTYIHAVVHNDDDMYILYSVRKTVN